MMNRYQYPRRSVDLANIMNAIRREDGRRISMGFMGFIKLDSGGSLCEDALHAKEGRV